MKLTWIVTTLEVYSAIYNHHRDQFTVFGSNSGGGHWDPGSDRWMTEWGFEKADAPLIKSDRLNGVWTYYIAVIESGG